MAERRKRITKSVLSARGVNREHDKAGLARTNADKRLAVSTLLGLEKWKNHSTPLIAEHCGVANSFVLTLKNELFSENGSPAETVESKEGFLAQPRKMVYPTIQCQSTAPPIRAPQP